MAGPNRNWARASKLWFPISTLPSGGTPVVLANDDQSIQWFAEKPSKKAINHKRQLQDEEGRPQYRERKDPEAEQQPVVEGLKLAAAWWSPAVFVDDRGEPVHE